MKKIIEFLLCGILLFFSEQLCGLPRSDRYRGLSVHGKIIAGDMVSECRDEIHRKDLNQFFNKTTDLTRIRGYVLKDENWNLFRLVFLQLLHTFPCGVVDFLDRDIVSKLESEGTSLLKLVGCPDPGLLTLEQDFGATAFAYLTIANRYYDGINTPVGEAGSAGTIIDCLDSTIKSTEFEEHKVRLSHLRDIFLEMGMKRILTDTRG
jgi:hypothetical protein